MRMDAVKIRNYEREHGPGTFPTCKGLDSRALQEIRRSLAAALGIESTASGNEILQAIIDRRQFVEGADAEAADFDLGKLLDRLGIPASGTFYINWHRYDEIDEMLVEDVIGHFSDIWYPSSDDIEVFDMSMSWVLSVTHYGAVGITRLMNG
jgi:hypothetical protein